MSLGDHIRVKRRIRYYHHGIDIGDKIELFILQVSQGKKKDASIQETSLEEFLNGRKIEIIRYSECFSPQAFLAGILSG